MSSSCGARAVACVSARRLLSTWLPIKPQAGSHPSFAARVLSLRPLFIFQRQDKWALARTEGSGEEEKQLLNEDNA